MAFHTAPTLGIPQITARAAALFRLLIGGLLLLVLLGAPGLANPDGIVTTGGTGVGAWEVIHWVKSSPQVHRLVFIVAMVAATAFTVGLWTRFSAGVLWCSLFVLIGASLITSGQHNWGVPLIALAGLMLVPLGDAWSVDAWRLSTPKVRSAQSYGLVLWWIGCVLGVAYFGAAIAKLSQSGLAWITTGAVRFHFIQDINQAPVTWGIWIAGREWLSILVSAVALAVEAAFMAVILTSSDRWRAVAGLAGVSLHLGFFLFQGVLWLPWIVLYVAFLPWQAISRALDASTERVSFAAESPATVQDLWRRWPAVAIAVAYVVLAQVYASARRVEYEPLFTSMPMYSDTFASWDDFFAYHRWGKYQTYAFRVKGQATADDGLRELIEQDADAIVAVTRARCSRDTPSERNTARLLALRERLSDRVGAPAEEVDVFVEDLREVDFAAGRLITTRINQHLATLNLSSATLSEVADRRLCLSPAPAP